MTKMSNLPLRNTARSPYRSEISPNVAFFEGNNYEKLDCITKRKDDKRLADEKDAAERAAEEKRRQDEYVPRESFLDQLLRAEFTKPEICKTTKKPFYGLRRPLEDGTTIEVEPGELDLAEWADKPYSTVASQVHGYQDIFPLHMQKVTEAEDKDAKQIQTETRRQSVITTDYMKGTIKLENSVDGHDVHLGVFPILHTIVSSESESESDDESIPESISSAKSFQMSSARSSVVSSPSLPSRFPERLPVEYPPGYNFQRPRRISIAAIAAGKHTSVPQPKLVRRRSLDYSGVSRAFVNALEAASNAMKSIKESKEDDDDTTKSTCYSDAAKAVFDPKYAEETMEHLEGNLRTLETFLENDSDSSSESSASDEEDDSKR